MKTKPDKTISALLISYGLIFIFPLFFNSSLSSILWTSIGALMILFGIWKIEAFEIKESKITKTNFCGLFRRTINLKSITHYVKKVIDTDHYKNPFNIVRLFSNNRKYLIFRQITIITDTNTKMKVDERTVNREDFNALYHKIKQISNRKII